MNPTAPCEARGLLQVPARPATRRVLPPGKPARSAPVRLRDPAALVVGEAGRGLDPRRGLECLGISRLRNPVIYNSPIATPGLSSSPAERPLLKEDVASRIDVVDVGGCGQCRIAIGPALAERRPARDALRHEPGGGGRSGCRTNALRRSRRAGSSRTSPAESLERHHGSGLRLLRRKRGHSDRDAGGRTPSIRIPNAVSSAVSDLLPYLVDGQLIDPAVDPLPGNDRPGRGDGGPKRQTA